MGPSIALPGSVRATDEVERFVWTTGRERHCPKARVTLSACSGGVSDSKENVLILESGEMQSNSS